MSILSEVRGFSAPTRKTLFVQWLTSIGYFSVIPFLVVYLVRFQHFSAEFATLQLSLFLIGQYGATFLGGLMTDRFSPNLTMKYGLILQIACYLVFFTGISQSSIICVLSTTIGISKGLFTPAAKTLVARVSAGSNKILLFSFRSTVNNVGVALGSAIGGLFITANSASFFAIAAASQLIALAMLFTLPTPAAIPADHSHSAAPPVNKGTVRQLGSNLSFIAACLLYCAFNFIYMQLESAFPLFSSQKWGAMAVSAIFMMNAAVVIFLQVLVNVYLNKWLSPWLSMCLGFMAFSLTFSLLGSAESLGAFIILIGFYTLGEITVDPTIDAVTSEAIPARMLGTAFGVLGIAGLIGGVSGNAFAGRFLSLTLNQPATLWHSCLAVSALGVGLTLLFSLKKFYIKQTQAG
ncbi:MFS transporter [Nissabacter archeti]|uniref:MFS transporter n=1 Tax=Nissabacter archeti TaxID=1917880 RepID=A0ABS5JEG0_9GAMM|nr:MFS transporter [Nissabacter archeti]MBS0967763.1 MFS transporter [Nissabacter archeti]